MHLEQRLRARKRRPYGNRFADADTNNCADAKTNSDSTTDPNTGAQFEKGRFGMGRAVYGDIQ